MLAAGCVAGGGEFKREDGANRSFFNQADPFSPLFASPELSGAYSLKVVPQESIRNKGQKHHG